MNIDIEMIVKLMETVTTDSTINIEDVSKDELINMVTDELISKIKTAITDAHWKYAYIQAIKPRTESGTPPLDD
ncbi:MAG: hypothetical protein LUG52_10165 [Clostridia bacterium]|nr:hypothetical protein [Clostridia bacterium]